MGPRVMRRPPKYVQALHRSAWQAALLSPPPRHQARIRLPGLPWSPEFMAAYEAALAGQPAPIGIVASEAWHISRARRELFRQPGHFGQAGGEHPIHRIAISSIGSAPSTATSGSPSCTASTSGQNYRRRAGTPRTANGCGGPSEP